MEKRWTQWLENFECCFEFEGVTDPGEGNSKKRAALLAIKGQQLRYLFKTSKPQRQNLRRSRTFQGEKESHIGEVQVLLL